MIVKSFQKKVSHKSLGSLPTGETKNTFLQALSRRFPKKGPPASAFGRFASCKNKAKSALEFLHHLDGSWISFPP